MNNTVQGSEEQHVDADRGKVLQERARRGIGLLVVRTVLVQLVVLGGQVALARILDPKDFGVFAIVQFVLSFFTFFGDAGLAGGLIQKQEQPTERELSSVFWAQLGMASVVVLLVVASSGLIRHVWPDLPDSGSWLLRALALGLLLTTLRTIPAILMERELQFGRLGIIDVVLSATFYIVATTLAWLGFQVWALAAGVLGQGVMGVILAYWFRPFRPQRVFDWGVLRPILKFGVPFQLNRAVGFMNFAVTPIYAGSMLGARPVGLINWAQSTAYFPLRLVEIVSRVSFPLYSRMQHDDELLAASFGRNLQLCTACTAFLVALFLGMGEPLIHVIYGDKWLPALPLLHAYAVAIAIGFLTPLAAPLLDATGRPKVVLKLSIFSTLASWALVASCTPRFGTTGFVWSYAAHVIAGNLILVFILRRMLPKVRLLRHTWAPALAGVGACTAAHFAAPYAHTIPSFVAATLGILALHCGAMYLLDPAGTRDAFNLIPTVSRGKPRPVGPVNQEAA